MQQDLICVRLLSTQTIAYDWRNRNDFVIFLDWEMEMNKF